MTPVNEAPSYDARAVANFLLDHAENEGAQITLMSLNKLIYYAHGWHLISSNRPLITQPFEAWQHGPVLRVLWEIFKGAGAKPIGTRATCRDLFTNSLHVVRANFPDVTETFLRNIFDAYGHLHAFQLSDMTHKTGSPWDRIWNAEGATIRLGMQIQDDEIREWFKKLPLLAVYQ